MKKNYPILFVLLFSLAGTFAQPGKITVFTSGSEGYKSFRIPAITSLPNGELLAFCEGRVNGIGDYGDINIVLKRSADHGKTWSELQTIVDYDQLQAGNPAPVLDLTDPAFPKGRLFLFYNTGNNYEGEIRKGNGLREAWYITSADNGITWSAPVNITLQVHKPKQPQVNAAYNFSKDWRCYANTPGHAIQLTGGAYKGRIFVAANHSAGEAQPHFTDFRAHGFYTDDHGKTFHLSADVNIPGGNENMATQLSGDKIMLNLRNQKGDVKARIVAVSNDGGATWDTAYFDKNLPDPICQGSILTIGRKNRRSIIAFCNAADTGRRDNLTLRTSFDGGKTWRKNFMVDKGPANYQGDYAAYSDLVEVDEKRIGILYEKNNYSQIVFTIVNISK